MTLSDDILKDAQAAAADDAVYKLMQDWVLDGGEETVMLAAMAQFVNEVNRQFRKMQN